MCGAVLWLCPQGACWSVAPYFPGPPPNMFDTSPTQRFFLQLTLGYIALDTFFVWAATHLLAPRVV